jgi:CheY-like chemotaxis protein
MDENMPIMSGIEATQKIRELEKKTNTHTPIIAVTANALSGDKDRFLEAGMDDYIPKPVELPILQDIISKYIR